jgi:Ran GTPase-activating protein (RanGAP) involved in mRNA processing and transport
MIDDEPCEYLVDGVMRNRTLENLDLGWNRIGTEGLSLLSKAIRSSNSLRVLNLSANGYLAENGFAQSKCDILSELLVENKSIESLVLDS